MPTANRVRSAGSIAGRSAISASAAAASALSVCRAAAANDPDGACADISLTQILGAIFVSQALNLGDHCCGHYLSDEIWVTGPTRRFPFRECIWRHRMDHEAMGLHRRDRAA